MYRSFFFHLSLESKVTVKVSSLPPQTTTDEIEAYFEKQGDHIEVLSTVNLGNGNAQVELSGLTSEGIHNNISYLHCELTVNAIPLRLCWYYRGCKRGCSDYCCCHYL